MADVVYQSHGTPLEEYQLTRSDHRKQKTAEQIHEAVERDAAVWQAAEAARPEVKKRSDEGRRMAWELIASFKTPDHKIMRWRTRLYCGHIVQATRHCENDAPTNHGSWSSRCPECGQDPAIIVAYEPLGLLAEVPGRPAPPPPPSPKKPTRAQLEHRVAALEAENRRLKARQRPEGEDG